MSHKGANYIIKEAGDEGKVAVDGRQCTVRASEEKTKAATRCEKSPPPPHACVSARRACAGGLLQPSKAGRECLVACESQASHSAPSTGWASHKALLPHPARAWSRVGALLSSAHLAPHLAPHLRSAALREVQACAAKYVTWLSPL